MITNKTPRIDIPYICEHDIDVLFLEELVASHSFLRWFTTQLKISGPVQLLSAAFSVSTSTGESDLELYVKSGNKSVGILVEDKLDAILQPHQADRYRERAENYIANGKCSKCITVIVAPRKYFADRNDTKSFDIRICMEDILRWFSSSRTSKRRKHYIIAFLKTAIEKGCVGWKLVPDQAVTEFWRLYSELAFSLAPQLQMPRPSDKPSGSTFVYFRPHDLSQNTQLVHKLSYGFIDLQFGGMGDKTAELIRQYGKQLGPGMYIDRAGKSGVIRIRVHEVDVTRPFSASEQYLRNALQEACRLLEWFRCVREKGL